MPGGVPTIKPDMGYLTVSFDPFEIDTKMKPRSLGVPE